MLILIMGILSLVFGCSGIGWILGIVGLVLGNKAKKAYETAPAGTYTQESFSQVKSGRIMSIIGIILGAVGIVFFIIYMIFIVGFVVMEEAGGF